MNYRLQHLRHELAHHRADVARVREHDATGDQMGMDTEDSEAYWAVQLETHEAATRWAATEIAKITKEEAK